MADKEKLKRIGMKLRVLRAMLQMTAETVAACLSMTRQGYDKVERGETKLDFEQMGIVCDCLKVSMDDFRDFDPSPDAIREKLFGKKKVEGKDLGK